MNRNLQILLIEDNDDDAAVFRYALKRAGIPNPLFVATDGQAAIQYLEGSHGYEDRLKYPFPSVIFTDIKMPRKTGFDVLEWLRAHPTCSVIPIIVLSGSSLSEDIKRAYEMGANAYLVKPSDAEVMQKMLKITYDFWAICEKPTLVAKKVFDATPTPGTEI
ncbi:MAG TPA: response regulator [Verrucomicrobiae bacterium]|nr:response regulator [Verrucomicrobiae bacterium]